MCSKKYLLMRSSYSIGITNRLSNNSIVDDFATVDGFAVVIGSLAL